MKQCVCSSGLPSPSVWALLPGLPVAPQLPVAPTLVRESLEAAAGPCVAVTGAHVSVHSCLLLLFRLPALLWVPFVGTSNLQTCWPGSPGNVPSTRLVPATGESVEVGEWCWVANRKSSIFSFLKNQQARAVLNADGNQQASLNEDTWGTAEWKRAKGSRAYLVNSLGSQKDWCLGLRHFGAEFEHVPWLRSKMCATLGTQRWGRGGELVAGQRRQWLRCREAELSRTAVSVRLPSLQVLKAVLSGAGVCRTGNHVEAVFSFD